MSELQAVGRENWEAFLGDGVAVLMLGKTDCAACEAWTAELTAFLAQDTELADVRFGKMLLNVGGLGKYKRASPWLAEVNDLPTNVLYVNGEPVKRWVGGGVDRMVNRVRRVI